MRGLKCDGSDSAGKQLSSHPTRVRGLKSITRGNYWVDIFVAPHTGAWIEIIPQIAVLAGIPESHPTRVRGLKYLPTFKGVKGYTVAPHTGAWIEIVWITPESVVYPSRTPRGCVD